MHRIHLQEKESQTGEGINEGGDAGNEVSPGASGGKRLFRDRWRHQHFVFGETFHLSAQKN